MRIYIYNACICNSLELALRYQNPMNILEYKVGCILRNIEYGTLSFDDNGTQMHAYKVIHCSKCFSGLR